jgi:hypothetical protein
MNGSYFGEALILELQPLVASDLRHQLFGIHNRDVLLASESDKEVITADREVNSNKNAYLSAPSPTNK